MTALFSDLALGLGAATTAVNLFYCLVGAMLGTLVGVLPGLGPAATVAMLLPVTFGLPPDAALIMLAGIYYGAQYGGSTTAILVNLPGESSSVVTALDGFQMARQGRAGPALATAAIGSFFAGSVATLLIALFAPVLAEAALKFGPAEYFALMVLGLIAAVVLANGPFLKALGMVFAGLLLGLVGSDVATGVPRFTFGVPELADGIGFVSLAMGVFGIGDIIASLHAPERRSVVGKVGRLWPSAEDWKAIRAPILRGTLLGALLGLLPGGGALLASFSAYALEKKISSTPQRFGRGAIEGVAAPEAANNAGAQTSFIPLLTLGIPANAVMALMVGAMLIHGIPPGPQILTDHKELFWAVVASMWVGNIMLVILNLPLIGVWIKVLTVPYRFLFPAIVLFCCIGAYSVANSTFDVLLVALAGLFGYGLYLLHCEPAPLLLGFILGPLMEENFRRAMQLARGDPLAIVSRPITFAFLLIAVALVVLLVLPSVRQVRQEAFRE